MTDPERLFETSEDEVARLILKAGRAGAPPGARERAIAVASSVIAGSSLAAGSAAAGSGVVAGKAGFLGALAGFKGLAVVGVACVATVGASVAIQKTWGAPTSDIETTLVAPSASPPFAPRASNVGVIPAPAASSLPSLAVTPDPSAAAETSATARVALSAPPSVDHAAASSLDHAPAEPETCRRPRTCRLVAPRISGSTRSVPTVTGSPATFTDELATLDSARHAIDAGDAARALSILDGYAQRFAAGVMGQEASILRVEALVKAGDRSAAERAADEFFRKNPTTPYAARVRSLVGAPNR
jgi:hypothetical protein